jgi:hypothetical protein
MGFTLPETTSVISSKPVTPVKQCLGGWKAGMTGVFRGGMRQDYLGKKFEAAEGREVHDLEFPNQTGWAMVNTTIGENQRCTLGFQLVYGDSLQVRVKEMFREYVPGAHAHYKFDVCVHLRDNWGGSVYVEIPDHRSLKRGQSREVDSQTPLHECLAARVSLVMTKMDGPVDPENQAACLCCG